MKKWKATILAIIIPYSFIAFISMLLWGDMVWGEEIHRTLGTIIPIACMVLFMIAMPYLIYVNLTNNKS